MSTAKPLTGRHVALIFGTAFTVIVSVNMTLAVSAVRTFPGLEVKNSYIASQSFDADRVAQDALEWTVTTVVTDTELHLKIANDLGPVRAEILKATLGRATHVQDDLTPTFTYQDNAFSAAIPTLAPGNWNLRLEARAPDGTLFKRRIVLRVPA